MRSRDVRHHLHLRVQIIPMRTSAKRAAAVILVAAAMLLSFTACNAEVREEYFDVFGTTLYIRSESDGGSVAERMMEDELLLSASVEGSDVYRINAARAHEPVHVDELTMSLLLKAREIYRLTDGAYDPSVYPLVELWGFAPGEFVQGTAPEELPTEEEISAALSLVGFDGAFRLDEENNTVTKLVEGAKLDLGGITKGMEAEKALGAFSGEALVNLGGNISCSGRDFTIGIGAPREYPSSYIGTVTLHSGECVSTSGDYERYYEIAGKRYHHIIDPSTGRSAASGLVSVTVISRDGALGDALSTAIMVAGEERGREWLEMLSADHSELAAVFVRVDDEGNILTSSWGREFKPN